MPRGGRGGDDGGGEDGEGKGGWRFALKRGRRRWRWRWPKAVVPRGGAAARWGRGGIDKARSWLRTRWRPVMCCRDVVVEAIATFVGAPPAPPAPLFLQPGPAARAAVPQRPVNAREENGRCHPCARVCVVRVGWRAARAREWKHTCLEPGKRHREKDGPSRSGRRADRFLVTAARTAVAYSSSSLSKLSCSGSKDSMCVMDCSISGGRSSPDHLCRCPGRGRCRLSSAKRACPHQSTSVNGVIHTRG